MPPRTDAPAARFAELYAADPDPWGTRTRWYERRKRAVLTACLPREHYAHAAEPGCGNGSLTVELAARCDAVTASEPDPAALAAARTVLAGRPGVVLRGAGLPDPVTVPSGVDLVVLSEVLYYLAPETVGRVLDRVAGALRPGGDVVVVNWLGRPAEAPMSADDVGRAFRGDDRLRPLVEHRDEEFRLDVLRRR
ncbi:class I SAM-dependent methyltransferase [Pseudonocardia nematodicida]|uniref:Class I SAM-dependent methyltransferase n=1 Tax=Pseudonocardia nematodicida TaxID=1206997 RepID=A0ABV1KHL1_9PSEU